MNAQRIEHLQDRTDFKLVQRDEDVRSIKSALGIEAPEIDGLFVKVVSGEVVECYGFTGAVPLLSLPLVRLI